MGGGDVPFKGSGAGARFPQRFDRLLLLCARRLRQVFGVTLEIGRACAALRVSLCLLLCSLLCVLGSVCPSLKGGQVRAVASLCLLFCLFLCVFLCAWPSMDGGRVLSRQGCECGGTNHGSSTW